MNPNNPTLNRKSQALSAVASSDVLGFTPEMELVNLRMMDKRLESEIEALRKILTEATEKIIRATHQRSDCKKAIAELTLVKLNKLA